MSVTIVKFSVGVHHCALPVSDLEEVLQVVAITPLPVALSFVEGVINRRGAVTPVIDLRKRIGVDCGPFDSSTHILIANLRGRQAGLIVDEVTDVVAVDASAIGVDPTAMIGGGLNRCASRIIKDEDGLVVILDPDRILTDDEGMAFDAAKIV